MSCPFLLPLALGALLLPGGWGLPCALLARWLGATTLETTGLLLLAAAALGRQQAENATGVEQQTDVVAVRLSGRWREPPGEVPHLATTHGEVRVNLAPDLRAPPPGTPVVLLARCAAGGKVTAVALELSGPPTGAWLDRWVDVARRRIRRLVRGERKGLVEALILGRRTDLEPTIVRDCRRSGTMHLLALSGLHVALVASLLARAAPRATAASWPLALLLTLFVCLAGTRPPLVRSLLAFCVARVGLACGRSTSGLRRLAVVALVVGAVQPAWIHDLGAQLSFLAVAGLLAALRLGGPLLAPWGACLATAPLCAEVFGQVQPWGVLATPLLVPLVGAVLALGLLIVLTGSLFESLDAVGAPLLDGAAAALRWALAQAAGRMPPPLQPPVWPGSGLALSVGLVALLIALAGRGRRA